MVLRLFVEHFKNNYGTECVAALHHNKRKTNYHIHLIFSERTLLEQPIEKIATRNMFYDESGKHVRTKKEILDENGQIRKRCKIIAKGEVYERRIFTTKDELFKDDKFLDEVKKSYTELINYYVLDDKQKLQVFDKNGVYLPTKKIGKNNPQEEQIKRNNFRHELKKYLKKNGYKFNDKQIELLTEFKFNECIKSKRLLIAKYEESLCLKKI